MCMVPRCATHYRSMLAMAWSFQNLKFCSTIELYIEQVLDFLNMNLVETSSKRCGYVRPWAPHLRLPLTKKVREEIQNRQASNRCEMVKKTVKKDPANGSQKTQVSKSQLYIEIQIFRHEAYCLIHLTLLSTCFRSGGAHMRSSAAYPVPFGRFVAKEHMQAMDTWLQWLTGTAI